MEHWGPCPSIRPRLGGNCFKIKALRYSRTFVRKWTVGDTQKKTNSMHSPAWLVWTFTDGEYKKGGGAQLTTCSHTYHHPDLPGSDWEAVVGMPTSGKGKCEISQWLKAKYVICAHTQSNRAGGRKPSPINNSKLDVSFKKLIICVRAEDKRTR